MDRKFKINGDDFFTTFVIKALNDIWGNTRNNVFPGSQPVTFERKNFEKLSNYSYYMSKRTDGIRCILYFMTDNEGQNRSILINKDLKVFDISLDAHDSVYTGTVFDGEIHLDDNSFVIHDSPMICGVKINKNNLYDRMCDISYCVDKISHIEDLCVYVKKFYHVSEMYSFKNDNHGDSGIIFVPESIPVISGVQYSMFTWRPVKNYTFNFMVCEDNNDIIVKACSNGKIIDYAKIRHPCEFIGTLKALDNYSDSCIVECSYINDTFLPIMIRDDKTHPNSLRTIQRTLFNIHENITLDEF